MWTRLTLVLACATPVAAETPIAEMICAPHAEIEARLTRGHNASLAALGLRGPDAVLQVWQTGTGDWTLVQAYANGQSCILAMGSDWADLAAAGG